MPGYVKGAQIARRRRVDLDMIVLEQGGADGAT